MGFGHISIPAPSTHAHTNKNHSRKHSPISSNHSSSSPGPGHLSHTQSLPPALDPNSHKHYNQPHQQPHHQNSNPLTHLTNINPTSYLSKHQKEYHVQHSFRSAKSEARKSLDTPIPSYPFPSSTTPISSNLTQEPSNTLTEEPSQISMSQTRQEEEEAKSREQAAKDQAAWDAILKAREAARRRSTIDMTDNERPKIGEWREMSEGSVRTANSRD